MPRPFRTVLVANRGEIAMRVLRTVKAMGLRGAVVYHAADRDAPAVAAADIAIPISGSTPVGAYLDVDEILRAATEANAGAIHPGYGFLSENAAFARRVADAGLVFIGPAPEAIDLMGDKVRARGFVERRGFPVAPSAIEDDDPASFAVRAAKVGFPLLIKPSAGGGGKGMRIVREAGCARRRNNARAFRRTTLLRGRAALRRTLRGAAAPYRGAGARRRAWQRGPSLGARMFRAAPLSKDPRRDAVAGAGARQAQRNLRDRGRDRSRGRL